MGFNWRGAFDCSASYAVGDAVSYQGSSWITNTPIGGCVQPPFSPWALLAQQGAAVGTYVVGTSPTAVAFDGTNIWVANGKSNSVTKLLASTGAVVGTYGVGGYPWWMAFDGTNIWVVNENSNN